MANQVVHFEVMGKDGPALRKFYGELFGWSFDEVDGMDYGMVQGADGGIGGGVGSSDQAPAYQTFYVQVDDLDSALEKAGSLGGKTTVDPMDLPGGGSIAMFTDPEGHLVGLFKPPAG
jgi:predicted enzyme related to lactoylglutathione lyase